VNEVEPTPAWEDEPLEDDLATKDPGDYHGGPCGVMVFLVPFVAIVVLVRLGFRALRGRA